MYKITRHFIYVICVAVLTSHSVSAAAQPINYISDSLFVPLRSGPGNEFRIINSRLRSGLVLTVLDKPKGEDWAKVKTPAGIEGWIRQQYLSVRPTAKLELQQLTNAHTELVSNSKALKNTHTQLTTKHNKLSSEHKKLVTEHAQLTKNHSKLKTLSQNAVSLNTRYNDLLAKHELLLNDFDAVQAENDRLSNSNIINQWLAGAGILILGMLITIIGPALKPKTRHSDWV